MSNYVKPSAIPWTERVCEEFEKQTGIKLLFEPPAPGDRENTTELSFYVKEGSGYRELTMTVSDAFMEDPGSAGHVSASLHTQLIPKSS